MVIALFNFVANLIVSYVTIFWFSCL